LGNATRKALFKPNNVISQNLPNIMSAMQQGKVERLLFVSLFWSKWQNILAGKIAPSDAVQKSFC
jgi:hypothetical protein